MGSFLPGKQRRPAPPITGAACTGVICRAITCARSHIAGRYGAKVIPEDMTIQDWAMT